MAHWTRLTLRAMLLFVAAFCIFFAIALFDLLVIGSGVTMHTLEHVDRAHSRSWRSNDHSILYRHLDEPDSNINTRAPKPKDFYKAAYKKGKDQLLPLLEGKKSAPTPTPWQYEDLTRWGWKNVAYNTAAAVNLQLQMIPRAIQSLGLSTQAGINNVVDWFHDTETNNGGRTYPKTEASYYNVYNPTQGAIYAYKNYGPRYKVGAKGVVPQLEHWSDVIYLGWMKQATTAEQRRNLRNIFRLKVEAPSNTGQVIQYVCKGAPEKWPGTTFKPGEKSFIALLGTEHVRGTAYLLRQHEQTLGKKTISGIQVWSENKPGVTESTNRMNEDGNWHIRIQLADLAQRSKRTIGDATEKSDCGGTSTLPDTKEHSEIESAEADSIPEPLYIPGSTDWNTVVKKGQQMWTMLSGERHQGVFGLFGKPKVPTPATRFMNADDLNTWGWGGGDAGSDQLETWFKTYPIQAQMKAIGLSSDSDSNYLVQWKHKGSWNKEGNQWTWFAKTNAINAHVLNPSEGAIWSYNNGSPEAALQNNKEKLWEDNADYHFEGVFITKLKNWSDVTFLVLKTLAQHRKIPLIGPKFIARLRITNPQTRDVIKQVMQKGGVSGTPPWPGKTFEVDSNGQPSEEILALLGTRHGAGVMYLLAQHTKEFGRKKITKVQVWYHDYKDVGENDKKGPVPHLLIYTADAGKRGSRSLLPGERLESSQFGDFSLSTSETDTDSMVLDGGDDDVSTRHNDLRRDSAISLRGLTQGHSSNKSDIEPRAPPQNFKEALTKGTQVMAMVEDPNKTKQAIWSYASLESWGWVNKKATDSGNLQTVLRGAESLFQNLRLNPETCTNMISKHSIDPDKGPLYKATDAEYKTVYCPSQGVVIPYEAMGPDERIRTQSQLRGSHAPALGRFSDVTWLTWSDLCRKEGQEPNNLKFIIIRSITNRQSAEIITEALRLNGWSGPGMPTLANKAVLSRSRNKEKDEAFLGAMGTVNLQGVAFFLAQHQKELGKKTVGSLAVWAEGGLYSVLVQLSLAR